MTLVIVFSAGFTLGLLTLTRAIPVPIPSGGGNQTLIKVYQRGTVEAATTTHTNSTILPGGCISIETTDFPTNITLDPQTPTGSYQLQGYPVNCCFADVPSSAPSTTVNFTDGFVIVNERHPICSLKVENILPGKKILVKFLGQENKGIQKNYNQNVTDNSCIDLCASTPWDSYVKLVKIFEYGGIGQVANNSIRIFSGTESQKCSGEIAQGVEIGHGANLARLTLVEPDNIIQSFTVVENK